MLQVSRDNNLKIPKKVDIYATRTNTQDDIVATHIATATANNQRIKKQELKTIAKDFDKDLEKVLKIPVNANDLMVITVVKKLGAYIITITEKSPKKFRGVFVNRMQNYCLETLQYLLEANFLRMDSLENKKKREEYQKEAIIKLKLLGYISMVAENAGCILARQYKQISIQLAEAINLITAWKKSDDERFKKRN